MISRNDMCWCGSGTKWKKCHYPSTGPSKPSSPLAERYLKQYGIILKTPEQIEGIRQACQVTAKILDALCKHAKAGVSTEELDQLACKLNREYHATAATLGYGDPPYPKSICTSLNDVICHGIPDSRKLADGDILNIDVSSILNNYYGDCSNMVVIGEVSEEKKLVVDVAREALYRAIAILKPGLLLCEIGNVIESYATSRGCSVVNQFVAHGVGIAFHEAPEVPHHYNRSQIPLVPGMTFTIEPMINAGARSAMIDKDQWTARTTDGKPSAQWEHTVLITEEGHEVLTQLRDCEIIK
ncbi:MAG: methionyl aminopeptidase [Simkania sp.]|nr:methionyl aminopeptidase [Simkania sp.]